MRHHLASFCCLLLSAFVVCSPWAVQAGPSSAQALRLNPVQPHVDFDRPTDADAEGCTIRSEQVGGDAAWVVESPEGVVLRKFVDTNGDNTVDQWRYFKDGLEVYRDIDADFDKRADQFRWFHTEGSRWGVDETADGKIDRWKRISPEEVSAEAVRALAAGDAERFELILLSDDELNQLGTGDARAAQIEESITTAVDRFRKLVAQQRDVTETSQWVQFSASQPGLVPKGTDGSTKDIEVYENAIAVVETSGEHGQVYVGTLVRVGDVWRMVDIPRPMSAENTELASRGVFFQPAMPERQSASAGAPSEKTQQLLSELEKLDAEAARATSPEEQGEYVLKRAKLLERIAASVPQPSERRMWLRQEADMLSAAVQTGQLPEGDERLAELFNRLKQQGADDDMLAYVKFRQYAAQYAVALQQPKANFQSLQETWLENLESFIKEYPNSHDAAEAMLQLAIAREFEGEDAKARAWYARVVEQMPDSAAAKKAAGARRRLESEGKTLELSGQSPDGGTVDLKRFRGKVVLVQYWATYSDQCKADMATLKELVAKHGDQFAVVGVNLDHNVKDLAEFLQENRLPWPQIYEEGGLDSRPANEMGILTVPTMILVDQQGRVIDRSIQASEIEDDLKELLSRSSARRRSSQR